LLLGTDESALFNTSNISWVGTGKVTVWTLSFVKLGEDTLLDKEFTESVVFFSRTITDVDVLWSHKSS